MLTSIGGIGTTFIIRILCGLGQLPTSLNARSDVERMNAQALTDFSTGLTEICWPTYWLILCAYWLLKTYRGIAFHMCRDILLLLPILVFVLLGANILGLRTWMWG